jgi:hypothetical protein
MHVPHLCISGGCSYIYLWSRPERCALSKIDKGSKVAARLAIRASCLKQPGDDVFVALWRNGNCESKEPSRKGEGIGEELLQYYLCSCKYACVPYTFSVHDEVYVGVGVGVDVDVVVCVFVWSLQDSM